ESTGRGEKILSAEQKDTIVAQLKEEARGEGKRAAWAQQTLSYLDKAPSPGVAAVLARCAAADDPFLREQVATALYFSDGPEVEPTLLRLTRDDGHGQKFEITEVD